MLLHVSYYRVLHQAPYFGIFLLNTVTIKTIKNDANKRFFALAQKSDEIEPGKPWYEDLATF